ncbi:hypothetical protein NUU61_006870 [Penicillium alfredii]|uniref:Uncharacterized protein n=1 Tax=Penicillium alfredii TaxID=1506179 RepID=A0A9W9F1R4_9EURO|nr:uncharacterized protein NUU61_006870 [Penicillium alfredii]KAJ5092000.1 hypothetical protein NUU61_006870 [Penicillium alfredii]
MNLCYPLAVYATVQKHLHQKLEYPGDLTTWETFVSISKTITLPKRPPAAMGRRVQFGFVSPCRTGQRDRRCEMHGLRDKEFGDIDRVFGFTDLALTNTFPICLSMAKA